MAIRNTQLGGSDWIQETPSFQDMNDTNDAIIDDYDDKIDSLPIRMLETQYTGSDLDINAISTNDTASHTIAISSETKDYDYIEIYWVGYSVVSTNVGLTKIKFTADTTNITSMDFYTTNSIQTCTDNYSNTGGVRNIYGIYAPTASQKTSGFDLNVDTLAYPKGYLKTISITIWKYKDGSLI